MGTSSFNSKRRDAWQANEERSGLTVRSVRATIEINFRCLELQNVTKIFGEGDTQVKALDDVSFSIKRGEFVLIVGSSGSGKSTLLNMIGLLDSPTNGNIFIDEINTTTLKKSLQDIIGVVGKDISMPILNHVLIEKEGNQIYIVATNLEVQITASIQYIECTDQ